MKGAMIRVKYIYLGVRGDISAKILTDLLFLRLSKILVLIGDQEIKIKRGCPKCQGQFQYNLLYILYDTLKGSATP